MTAQEAARAMLALYNNQPERWCQGAIARDATGTPTAPWNDHAVTWCLSGAFTRVLERPALEAHSTLTRALGGSFMDFNDAPSRTFAELVAKLEEIANG
jgi:hypothetical protein